MAETPNYPIGSVDSALRLLLMVADQGQMRITDAADALGVARSTAHRLFAMLTAYGFVTRDPQSKQYRAGPALLRMGLSAVRDFDVRARMRPFLERLVQETGETAHLIILQGSESFFVDSVEGPQAVRTGSRVGVSFPAYTTSGGKALLATLSPTALRALYPDEQLAAMSSSTIATRSDLERELAKVRSAGYALNLGETDEQVGAIGAAVMGPAESAVCAIAIAAPLSRTNRARLRAMSGTLLSVTEDAARSLGETA